MVTACLIEIDTLMYSMPQTRCRRSSVPQKPVSIVFLFMIFNCLVADPPAVANDPPDTHGTTAWRIGMSAAFSGPAQELGRAMRTGIEAQLDAVNANGGVHGRPLQLIALDDAYEPSQTAPNMRRLIDEHQVLAVIGNVGTPTAAVAVPIAAEKRIPLFGAFTGAGLLRQTPPDRYVINFRASYAQETAEMIRVLTEEMNIRPREIGFFTQNDAYGDAGWQGAVKALKDIGYPNPEQLPHGRYTRNTVDIEDGLSRLLDPHESVRAVIMVGAYKPCAKFIRMARKYDFNPVFLNVSFVGSSALVNELGNDGEGVIITQVVPTPNGNTEAAIEFQNTVPPAKQNFVSFEGFLVAKAFVESLRFAGPSATSEDLIDVLESGRPIDLGMECEHRLSPQQHQFSHRIWTTVIRDGQLMLLTEQSEKKNRGKGQ